MKKTDREGETLRAKGQGKTVSFCAWAARCGYQLVCVCGESTVPTFEHTPGGRERNGACQREAGDARMRWWRTHVASCRGHNVQGAGRRTMSDGAAAAAANCVSRGLGGCSSQESEGV
jgi:hypothetical protein